MKNLFSQIRAMGNDTHPGPVQFIQRIDNIILRADKSALIPLKNPSTKMDDDSYFLTQEIGRDLPAQKIEEHILPEDEASRCSTNC